MVYNIYLTKVKSGPALHLNVYHPIDTITSLPTKLFVFNPNTIDKNGLQTLGLNELQVRQWIAYRKAIGKFRELKQIKKIYAMDDSTFERLLPYIQLESVQHKNLKQQPNSLSLDSLKTMERPKEKHKVFINSATETDWMKLKGIGPVFASRIVSYRSLLGGFHNTQQLREVYGLSDSLFQQIFTHLNLDTIKLSTTNINTQSVKQLAKHPYINWNIANSLVQMREQHGCFSQLADIKKSNLVNDSIYLKIAPYLSADSCQLNTK